MSIRDLKIFTGNANRVLAQNICEYLRIDLGKSTVKTFSDGEIFVEIDESVRGQEVFVIQSTSAPANHNLMELLIMIDALKRASAKEITAVLPYFGYARQDRKVAPRTPISAKLVSDLIAAAGATRIVSMDLHAGQIQGFFNVPFDHLYCSPLILKDIRENFNPENLVIVSPDAGGVERTRAIAKKLGADLAIVDKRRPEANQSVVMNIIGDVKGKVAILYDDMIDTAGTIVKASAALTENGAVEVHAYCSHPVFSGPAIERLESSTLKTIVASDTIPLTEAGKACSKVKTLCTAELLGEAIRRISSHDSISSLFI
jgi:ribose-phosphate pyrophosphokinase